VGDVLSLPLDWLTLEVHCLEFAEGDLMRKRQAYASPDTPVVHTLPLTELP
jgi:hypothetical protein